MCIMAWKVKGGFVTLTKTFPAKAETIQNQNKREKNQNILL